MTDCGSLMYFPTLTLWLHTHVVFLSVTGVATFFFVVWWSVFWLTHRGQPYFFFDPQDYFHATPEEDRISPKAAETATFEPMLKHYIGVTQLLVTIAAASIAFGGGNGNQVSTTSIGIAIAKLLLAWSVFYGVLFCALLLWRYDEYTQNKKSYILPWHATVFACGMSSLTFFTFGFVFWGFGLV
jgi:hypothetical protein